MPRYRQRDIKTYLPQSSLSLPQDLLE